MEAIRKKGNPPDGYIPVSASNAEARDYQQEPYSTGYRGRTVERSTGYVSQGRMGTSYQGRTDGFEGRMDGVQGRADGIQGRTDGIQGRADGIQGRTDGVQGRTDGVQGRTEYQGRIQQHPQQKMAEDYKRERKLPPRVEEMLREQVNLDESVLHDAFAVAMEDLIPEQEANFVAKGLCHLCGAGGTHYVPVVNFCPHADERHSLCREHLRSVYRVRMEALFVGRNGSAPNRRLLRCLVCTSGCPCTNCKQVKDQEVQKYKRYLMDTLRRNGHGGTAVKDARAATPTGADGRVTYSSAPNVANSDIRRYVQYPPGDGRARVQRDGMFSHNVENGGWEGRRQMPPQSEYERYPPDERSNRDNYLPNMQAQQKPLYHYPPVPKRAAKDTPTDMLSVIADSAQAADPRVAARVASPRVHQGSAESPTAATLLNCAESEKSLVHLLSTLNQGATPSSTMAMELSSQSSKDSTHLQSDLRYVTNGIVVRNGTSGYAQDSEDQGSTGQTEASPRVHAGRGIASRCRQADSAHQYQSSTSSMDSAGKNAPRDRSNSGARAAEALARSDTHSDSNFRRHDGSTAGSTGKLKDEEKRRYLSETRPKLTTSKLDRNANDRAAEAGKKSSRSMEPSPADGRARHLQLKESRSAESSPAYGPGHQHHQSRGTPSNVSSFSSAERKSPHERKTTPPPKRGRGRPPKNAQRVKRDEDDTEDEVYYDPDEEEEREEGDSDSELDTNLDFCEVCQGAGDLVCCDKCPRSFHLKCLHMQESDLPEGDWQCAECRKPSRFDSYSTAVASERSLLDKCLKIVECLKSHPFSKPFLTPVENVPMYTRVVQQPMDMSTIEEKLKKGAYIVDSNTVAAGVKELDSTHFANDIRLMWSNCKLFNDDGSGITRAADILSAGFERLYKESIEPPLTT